jgi:5'-3' exonuclease
MALQYVVVDMGYLLFYRLTATMRDMSHQRKDDATPTTVDSEDTLVGMFSSHLRSQLDKLKKKYGNKKHLKASGTNAVRFIFCKDDHKCNLWRTKFYPAYKANRAEADDLVHRLQDVVHGICEEYGRVIFVDELEADDIAALVVRHIRSKNHETGVKSPIVLVTSDRDYLQLCCDELVTIIDGTGKEVKGINAKIDLMMKILMGDKSDNIPAVCKGMGKKTAESVAMMSEEERTEYLQKKGGNCIRQCIVNEKLVDLSFIPTQCEEKFNRILKSSPL